MTRSDTHTAADLARLTDAERARVLRLMPVARAEALRADWRFWARAEQLPPEGDDWRIWLLMAGRGFGKTRAGAEWVRSVAEADGAARIALVGSTLAEARAVMVEGESGLLAIAPDAIRPTWEPSLRRLTWPNGAVATLYSAAEPEALRGPQHSHGWCDEIAKWPHGPMAWDNLMLGLRLGERPRVVATTTPRPVPLARALVAQGDVAVTGGRSVDNRANLPPDFLSAVEQAYGGTRFGRQELDGELIEEVEGALWSRDLIERCRVREAPKAVRVVIGVDPPAGAGEGSDACGILVAALDAEGVGHVIEDASVQGLGPEGWARAVASAAERHRADRVVAEANNGGAMVESVLRAADSRLPRPARPCPAEQGGAGRAGGDALRAGAGAPCRRLSRAGGRAGGADGGRQLCRPRLLAGSRGCARLGAHRADAGGRRQPAGSAALGSHRHAGLGSGIPLLLGQGTRRLDPGSGPG